MFSAEYAEPWSGVLPVSGEDQKAGATIEDLRQKLDEVPYKMGKGR